MGYDPAADPLLDDQLPPTGADVADLSEVQLHAVAADLLRTEAEAARLAELAKQLARPYADRVQSLRARAQGAREVLLQACLLRGDSLRYPDIGTFYLTNKDAKPRLRLAAVGGQEAAASHVGADPENLFHKRVFDAQAYLAHAQAVLEARGEMLPGVEAYTPEPTLAARKA